MDLSAEAKLDDATKLASIELSLSRVEQCQTQMEALLGEILNQLGALQNPSIEDQIDQIITLIKRDFRTRETATPEPVGDEATERYFEATDAEYALIATTIKRMRRHWKQELRDGLALSLICQEWHDDAP